MKIKCIVFVAALACATVTGCVYKDTPVKDPIVHPTHEQVHSAENEATISPAFVPWWVEAGKEQ